MTTLKNVSPLGDVDVPGVGIIPAGEEFEVDAETAKGLIAQPDNFQPVTAPKKKG